MDSNEHDISVSDMRADYTLGELRREDLRDSPIEQFRAWFQQAIDTKLVEPNAMSLATTSLTGQPSLRTVLLKIYDEAGFVFFTNLESRKAREIADNPQVALLFPWVSLQRQVIITGSAERVSTAEAAKYFVTRPRGSQIAAWVSQQSSVIAASGETLRAEWERLSQKFANGDVPLPPFWSGFRVKPRQIEFWQGRSDRLHDRFRYTRRDAGSWTIDRLSP